MDLYIYIYIVPLTTNPLLNTELETGSRPQDLEFDGLD